MATLSSLPGGAALPTGGDEGEDGGMIAPPTERIDHTHHFEGEPEPEPGGRGGGRGGTIYDPHRGVYDANEGNKGGGGLQHKSSSASLPGASTSAASASAASSAASFLESVVVVNASGRVVNASGATVQAERNDSLFGSETTTFVLEDTDKSGGSSLVASHRSSSRNTHVVPNAEEPVSYGRGADDEQTLLREKLAPTTAADRAEIAALFVSLLQATIMGRKERSGKTVTVVKDSEPVSFLESHGMMPPVSFLQSERGKRVILGSFLESDSFLESGLRTKRVVLGNDERGTDLLAAERGREDHDGGFSSPNKFGLGVELPGIFSEKPKAAEDPSGAPARRRALLAPSAELELPSTVIQRFARVLAPHQQYAQFLLSGDQQKLGVPPSDLKSPPPSLLLDNPSTEAGLLHQCWGCPGEANAAPHISAGEPRSAALSGRQSEHAADPSLLQLGSLVHDEEPDHEPPPSTASKPGVDSVAEGAYGGSPAELRRRIALLQTEERPADATNLGSQFLVDSVAERAYEADAKLAQALRWQQVRGNLIEYLAAFGKAAKVGGFVTDPKALAAANAEKMKKKPTAVDSNGDAESQA